MSFFGLVWIMLHAPVTCEPRCTAYVCPKEAPCVCVAYGVKFCPTPRPKPDAGVQ
jgi:hypothetical protein